MYLPIPTLASLWAACKENGSPTRCLLAVDIGGTKIGYALFPIQGNALHDIPLFSSELPTPKGKEALLAALWELVRLSLEESVKKNLLVFPVISIGSPGRFIGPEGTIIAKGSAENMSLVKGEFDGVNLSQEIKRGLPEDFTIIVNNDAVAQMAAGVNALLQDPVLKQQLAGQKVGYIGPGTGLGGGFGQLDNEGHLEVYSDGHIYDILIPFYGQSKRAEDVFSGRACLERTGLNAKNINHSEYLFQKYLWAVEEFGHALPLLIEKIYRGQFEKLDPEAQWPAEDMDRVRGTALYLIGGGMGTSSPMGSIIIQTAQHDLKEKGLDFIRLIPIPQAPLAALVGAAQFGVPFIQSQ